MLQSYLVIKMSKVDHWNKVLQFPDIDHHPWQGCISAHEIHLMSSWSVLFKITWRTSILQYYCF